MKLFLSNSLISKCLEFVSREGESLIILFVVAGSGGAAVAPLDSSILAIKIQNLQNS